MAFRWISKNLIFALLLIISSSSFKTTTSSPPPPPPPRRPPPTNSAAIKNNQKPSSSLFLIYRKQQQHHHGRRRRQILFTNKKKTTRSEKMMKVDHQYHHDDQLDWGSSSSSNSRVFSAMLPKGNVPPSELIGLMRQARLWLDWAQPECGMRFAGSLAGLRDGHNKIRHSFLGNTSKQPRISDESESHRFNLAMDLTMDILL
ncbi:hypothetical protein OSB04_001774 [Centaurea solstitialis]|uniref:Uncharacterized protein n=1 Tax=Centaurea solstitialis TaxID=347529 RepID=A0AA38UAE8_9ASTR|nr:hypothetical protein OSB04_001774 [Centaurea solstitialis]